MNERVRLRLRRRQLDDELDQLRLEELPAEREFARARDMARAELAAAIDARRRDVIARLDAALASACRINDELALLDEQAERVLGTMTPRFAWAELFSETPTCDSRLAAWQRAAREHGLLV